VNVPHVEIVPTVTREQAERFAQAWFRWTIHALAMCDVFGAAEVMEYPDDREDSGEEYTFTPEQDRYQRIKEQIVAATLGMAKGAMAEAFFSAATVILARERER